MVFQYHFIDAPMESTGMHREKSIKKLVSERKKKINGK